MRVMICGLTYESGNIKFDELMEENKENILNITKYNNGNSRFTTKDGDYYKIILPTNIHVHANRCDKVYIDKNIDEALTHNLLFPLVVGSIFPYAERVIYF